MFLKFDKLSAYSGNLTQLIRRKLKKPCTGAWIKESFGAETEVREILCEKLHLCGIGQSRPPPPNTVIFHDIKLLASLHGWFKKIVGTLASKSTTICISN